MDVSIEFLTSALREPCGRGGGKSVKTRGDGGHQKNNEKKNSYKFTETEAASLGPAWICTRSPDMAFSLVSS